MRWIKRQIKNSRKIYKWHKWFALYPVIVSSIMTGNTRTDLKIWLETIQRRKVYGHWQYRNLELGMFEELKSKIEKDNEAGKFD